MLSRNHQLFLGLVTGQMQTPEGLGGRGGEAGWCSAPVRVKDIGHVEPGVKACLYRGHCQRGSGRAAERQSTARQQHGGRRGRRASRDGGVETTLPAGVEAQPFYDQSDIVNASIASVRDAIIIGLFLAGLIIWLFLRDMGTAVMTGLVVPVTMLRDIHRDACAVRASI